MKYKKAGNGYQLAAPETLQTSFRLNKEVRIARIVLSCNGELNIAEGYFFDGATGMIDTETNLRGAVGHDALYNLSRMGVLPHRLHKISDNLFCQWLKEDGSWSITIRAAKLALKIMRGRYAHPKQRRKIYNV